MESKQKQPETRSMAMLYAAMPAVFVFFWSTGFVTGKLGLQSAAPFTFLLYRFLIVAALLLPLALIWRAPWPSPRALAPIAIGGVLVHAGYLGAVFAGLSFGVEAGVGALMAGLQPLLTAVFAAPFLGERVTARQWAGLSLGFVGVTLVVWEKLGLGLGTPIGMFFSFMSVVFMTAGTLWQKKFGGAMDLRTGSIVQFVASAIVVGAARMARRLPRGVDALFRPGAGLALHRPVRRDDHRAVRAYPARRGGGGREPVLPRPANDRGARVGHVRRKPRRGLARWHGAGGGRRGDGHLEAAGLSVSPRATCVWRRSRR